MFHQMECLERMRVALRRDDEGKGKEKRKDFVVVNGGDRSAGWGHCLDYLRQSVLCGADDTMEVSEGDAGGWDTFGYGSRRQCRDPKWLFDVMKCGEQGARVGLFFTRVEESERVRRCLTAEQGNKKKRSGTATISLQCISIIPRRISFGYHPPTGAPDYIVGLYASSQYPVPSIGRPPHPSIPPNHIHPPPLPPQQPQGTPHHSASTLAHHPQSNHTVL